MTFGKVRNLVVVSVLGAFFVSLPVTGEAKRLHDPQVATKVDVHNTLQRQIQLKPNVERNSEKTLEERVQAILQEDKKSEESMMNTLPTVNVPKTADSYDDSIIGTALATKEQCVRYLLSVNPHPSISVSPEQLVSYYYEEGSREGIRPDVAFAQALKETGFFRYGGTVTADQNNYCGLGTTSATVKGAYFGSSQLGVRAHIQHLLAYASTRKPAEPVVDPRYSLVRQTYGDNTLGTWEDLNGRWAVPGYSYGQSILSMFQAILQE